MCDTSDNNQQSISSTVAEEPLLGTHQADIDLLAAEIAEAAAEEERRSMTPSPDPAAYRAQDQQHSSRLQVQDDDVEDVDKGLRDKHEEEEEGSSSGSDPPMDMSVIQEEPISTDDDVDDDVLEISMIIQQEDMDEASWVMVDSDIEDPSTHTAASNTTTESENTSNLKCIFRKFLTTHEMGAKLLELGLTQDSVQDSSLHQMEMSDSGIDHPSEDFLKNPEESSNVTIWRGEVSGAKVCVEGEQRGGLLVADVRLWHKDLLQALAALKNLANNAGLISYADVDVSSLLARAA